MHPLQSRLTSLARVAVTAALIVGCGSPTDVDRISAGIQVIPFSTETERLEWLSLPIVEGGQSLIVRGMAMIGCGRPEATARRHYNVVSVEIRAVDTHRICLGVAPWWVPVEATVTGLRPGSYRVRLRVAGHSERTEGTATITAP